MLRLAALLYALGALGDYATTLYLASLHGPGAESSPLVRALLGLGAAWLWPLLDAAAFMAAAAASLLARALAPPPARRLWWLPALLPACARLYAPLHNAYYLLALSAAR